MAKLTDVSIRAAKSGKLQDGDGLMLVVKPSGSKFWVVRVMRDGKRSDIGLGSYPAVSLADTVGGLNMAIAANSRNDAPRVWQALRAIHAVTKWTGGMPPLETDEAALLTARDGLLSGVG